MIKEKNKLEFVLQVLFYFLFLSVSVSRYLQQYKDIMKHDNNKNKFVNHDCHRLPSVISYM